MSPILKYTNNWEAVSLFSSSPLKAKDLKFLLEDLKINNLCSSCRVENGFKYDGLLKMEKLFMRDSNWITLDALLSMECREIEIRSPVNTFSFEDLNSVVKCWMAGGLSNLELFCIFIGIEEHQEWLETILKGIGTFSWSIENRPESWSLEFSLLSLKCKRIAKSINYPLESLKCDFGENIHKLVLQHRGNGVLVLQIRIPITESSNQLGHLRLDGSVVPMIRRQWESSGYWLIGDEDSSEENNLKIIENMCIHIMDVLKVGKCSISLGNVNKISEMTLFESQKAFEDLSVNQPISGDDAIFVLEHLDVRNLTLSCQVENGFEYSAPLKTRHLRLWRNAEWLTADALLKMKCKRIQISSLENRLTVKDLNNLIKKWMSGGLENLEEFVVAMERNGAEEKLENIVEGIETTEWDPNQKWYGFRKERLPMGHQIERNDGKLATAFYCAQRFTFYIGEPRSNY